MNTEILIEDSWKKDKDTSRVIKFYVEDEAIKDSFSYIYDEETDEIEFSFDLKVDLENPQEEESFPIYYTVNGRTDKTEGNSSFLSTRYKIATINITGAKLSSTVIVRVPAYNKLIREDYNYSKSQLGLISPNDYNPILGSNLYKNQGDNVYITKDTYEDYIRSSNVEGHPLDEVGRRQVLKDKGYYKIYKTLRIKCNQLERTVDSDGNYYSSDRSTNFYVISGVYTYDLYDSDKNLLRENVLETTPHVSMFNTTLNKRAFNPEVKGPNGKPTEKPVLGKVFRLDSLYESYNHTYVGQLFYEDFDGVIRFIQSENHITLEKFVAVNFGEDANTPVYWENNYPLYIVGPNKGDSVSFFIELEKTSEEENENSEYPIISNMKYAFSNPDYKKYFSIKCIYFHEYGKIQVTISALENNDDSDPWRPSYSRVLPSLEKTSIKLNIIGEDPKYITAVYYVIQKSSRIGIIPKRYSSKESTTPIDLDRDEFGRYLLKISEGIGVKMAYLGITSEVDPYDRDIVRSWDIQEVMTYTDETGSDKIKEREYFFENYTGKFEDKIVFITGSYNGELTPFRIRDYIDRSDVWRQAIYESEVTVIPIIDNIDKTVDLGGGWSYTLDTSTNYFIGTNLLYIFNENNRYYTQRFNLEFTTPEHTGPSFGNFKASINNVSLLGGTNGNETYDDESGISYTFYDNPVNIYNKLFGESDTYRDLIDREKNSEEEIEIKCDDNFVTLTPSGYYIKLTTTDTGCPVEEGSTNFLNLTTEDTGYPAFFGDNNRIKNTQGIPMFLPCVTDTTNWEALDENGNSYDPKKYVDITSNDTDYPAYRVTRENYVDKYKTLLEIKTTNRKRLFFCFEDIVGRIVKFDIIYPQDSDINTRDIEQIPTVSPLKFVFKLIETEANYELQEIRFYCGIEGIQPLKLLSSTNDLYPTSNNYTGYPEIELKDSSSKFNVISETYSEAFPNWRLISAYDTFNYTWPNENKIIAVNDSSNVSFYSSESYLQVDYKDINGGSDFIDFIRVKEGNTNWWNDWRYFIYNKFTNRFSLYCSSGSPELTLTDGNGEEIKTIAFNRIGLYRIFISVRDIGTSTLNKLLLTQTSGRVNNLYTINFDDNAFDSSDPKKLKKGHIRGKNLVIPNTPISIKTVSENQNISNTSLVLYLWYEGCGPGEEIKEGGGRLEFELSLTTTVSEENSGEEITFKKSISITQSPINGVIEDADDFFKLTSYKFNSISDSVETAIDDYGNRFSIQNSFYGLPIFNTIPGRIELTNENFPYKLGLKIGGNDDNFLKYNEIYEIDSPISEYSQGIELEEENCYIKNSFIKCTYEFKPSTYNYRGIGGENEEWEKTNFYNQPRRQWIITFTDGRNNTYSNTLYYDSPINVNFLELVSLGALNHISSLGRSDNDFKANAGVSLGLNNDSATENINTFYYRYSSSDQILKFPKTDIERLVINTEDPIDIHLVTQAEDGSTLSNIEEINTNRKEISLVDSYSDSDPKPSFLAFKWSSIINKEKEFTLHLYNDSESGSTNIPLTLLELFGLSDEDKNVGWVTTAALRLKLKVKPPEGITPGNYKKMVTDSDNTKDSGYPNYSNWYGIGQQLVSKIELNTYNIQPSSLNGTENNPTFTIPLGWFNNSLSEHTIEITVNSRYSAEKLIYGVEIREKSSNNAISNIGLTYDEDKITLTFTKPLTTDIVVIPKFTNIEHECLNPNDFKSSNGPTITQQRELRVLKLNENNEIRTETGAITTIPKTISPNLIGFKIKDYHENNQYLNLSGRLNKESKFSTALMQIVSGYPISLEFKVDNKNQLNSTINLSRLGYNYAIFIQPGYFFQKPSHNYNLEVLESLYINWYSFRQKSNSIEGNSYGLSYDSKSREIYILLPRNLSDSQQRLTISRGAPTSGVSENPNIGGFFIQELTIPIYELGYRGGFTYSGNQLNSNISIIGNFNNNIDNSIHPVWSNNDEYFRLVTRKGYQFFPGEGNISGGIDIGNSDSSALSSSMFGAGQNSNEEVIDGVSWGIGTGPSEDIHSIANIMGPYPNNNIQIKDNNNNILYNLIITDS